MGKLELNRTMYIQKILIDDKKKKGTRKTLLKREGIRCWMD